MKWILLILFIIIGVYIVYTYKRESYKDIPIDMVYLWVANEDPERVEYLSKLPEWDGNLDKTRYSEHNELMYSLRSVEEYCPWVRTIYIVTKDGQIPPYVDFKNPKIKLVHHSQIMPHSSLPTFNSMAIEACVHHIPNLSDHYIYMNDDIFFMEPITPDAFLEGDIPRVYVREKNRKIEEYSFDETFEKSMELANRITGQEYYIELPHTPTMCYKPWDKEIEDILRHIPYSETDLWNWTVHSKFRENNNIAINNCFRTIYYMYKGGIKMTYPFDMFNLKDTCMFTPNKNITFLCINHVSDMCDKEFKIQMSNLFPYKSKFEK